MPHTVHIDASGPWLVIDYEGSIDEEALVAARAEAASLNGEGQVRDFILDVTGVTQLILAPEGVERIAEIDRAQSRVLLEGRCALVAQRENVELGTTFLGSVSPLGLDFRAFRNRSNAEAWLRGDLSDPPPPLPRSRRR